MPNLPDDTRKARAYTGDPVRVCLYPAGQGAGFLQQHGTGGLGCYAHLSSDLVRYLRAPLEILVPKGVGLAIVSCRRADHEGVRFVDYAGAAQVVALRLEPDVVGSATGAFQHHDQRDFLGFNGMVITIGVHAKLRRQPLFIHGHFEFESVLFEQAPAVRPPGCFVLVCAMIVSMTRVGIVCSMRFSVRIDKHPCDQQNGYRGYCSDGDQVSVHGFVPVVRPAPVSRSISMR